jgi:hypothetical protein
MIVRDVSARHAALASGEPRRNVANDQARPGARVGT